MSVYRVATAYSYDNTIRRLQQRQAELSEQQDKLSSGKRVRTISDDPAATALAEREQARMQRLVADQRSLDASRRNLELAESTLATVTDLYHRAKELIIQGGNGALNLTDRETIANELEGIRDRILAMANEKDTLGRPIFMGQGVQNTQAKPFVEVGGAPPVPYGADSRAVQTYGLPGQASPTETSLPSGLDGRLIFGFSYDGTTYTQGNDSIWETLDRAIYALRNNTLSPGQLSTELGQANGNLATRLDAVMTARAQLGDWLNRADSMKAAMRSREDYHIEQASELTDLDMVEAISRFQTLQLGYQAGLSSYAQVQRLSLFQYLA